MLDSLETCWGRNKTLGRYDLKHNNITDDGVDRLIAMLGEAPHVYEVEISEWINEETMELFNKALVANKPKKGKKGKKKK